MTPGDAIFRTRSMSTRVLFCPKNLVLPAPSLVLNCRTVFPGSPIFWTLDTVGSGRCGGLALTMFSSVSNRAATSSSVSEGACSPFRTGVKVGSRLGGAVCVPVPLLLAFPPGVEKHGFFCGRPGSVISPSDPSDRAPASWSAAYLHDRCDLVHCAQGHDRSHLSFRFRHSVHDLTGRGLFTLRVCCWSCVVEGCDVCERDICPCCCCSWSVADVACA